MATTRVSVNFQLFDTYLPEYGSYVNGVGNWMEGGVELGIEGYGECSSNKGEGTPVFLEFYNGELRLIVWADINSEEPTHVISLEGAKESLRKPEKE